MWVAGGHNGNEHGGADLGLPQPRQRSLHLQLPPVPTTVSLIDALGRSVLVQHSTGASAVIDASGLRSGTYFVRTNNLSGSPLHLKWIKQ
ncbi:MAG: T9SS type A sorting domain-containing protein [Flavobacteriales bacterium]|nr:T9SS type A sorting domain-containing protein [Flavobacteriales bacterium]